MDAQVCLGLITFFLTVSNMSDVIFPFPREHRAITVILPIFFFLIGLFFFLTKMAGRRADQHIDKCEGAAVTASKFMNNGGEQHHMISDGDEGAAGVSKEESWELQLNKRQSVMTDPDAVSLGDVPLEDELLPRLLEGGGAPAGAEKLDQMKWGKTTTGTQMKPLRLNTSSSPGK